MKFKIMFGKILVAQTFLIFCFASSVLAQGQKADGTQEVLSSNQTIKRDLRGGEKHNFIVGAKKGEFVRAIVNQQGVDLLIKVFAPDNAPLFERDTPNGAFGDESVSFVAETDGNFRLEISSLDEKAAGGRYEARLEAQRKPTENDLLRVRAEKTFSEAMDLQRKQTPEANHEAKPKFESALKDFQALGDKYREANALAILAFLILEPEKEGEAANAARGAKSLEMLNRSFALARETGDKQLETLVLFNLGEIYFQLKKPETAIDFYARAADLAKIAGNVENEIYGLSAVAGINGTLKRWQKAVEAYQKILALHRASKNQKGEAETLNYIGVLTSSDGRRKEAIRFYEEANAIYRELKNAEGEILTFSNIAVDLKETGENEKAIEAYRKVFALQKENPAKAAETLEAIIEILKTQNNNAQVAAEYKQLVELYRAARNEEKAASALNDFANFLADTNEREKAADFYIQSLEIYRALKKTKDEAQLLYNIGLNYEFLKNYPKAVENFRAAEKIYRLERDVPNVVKSLERISMSHKAAGDFERAIAVYKEIPPVYREAKDERNEAVNYNRIGVLANDALAARSDKTFAEEAEKNYNLALEIARRLNEKTLTAQILNNLGVHFTDAGEKEKAIRFFQEALAVRRELKLKADEAETLLGLGEAYSDFDDRKAIEFYRQALALFAELKDAPKQAMTLNAMAVAHENLSELKNALENYRLALPLFQKANDREGLMVVTKNIGKMLHSLQDIEKAMAHYEEAVKIARELKKPGEEADLLRLLASLYYERGDSARAASLSAEALRLAVEAKDEKRIASIAFGTALRYANLAATKEELDKALALFQKSLEIDRRLGDRNGEASGLQGIALIHYLKNDYKLSFEYMQQALPIAKSLSDKRLEAKVLSNLMILLKNDTQADLAIFYGKQSVNLYQQLRTSLVGIEKELQQSFLKSNEDTYRKLADLLINEGRIPEAQAVLDLLKEEELSAIVRRSGEPLFALPYSRAEEEAIKIVDKLALIGREIGELKARKKNAELSAAETERLNQLEFTEIPAANRALRQATEALATTAPDVGKELDRRMKDNVQNILPELGTGVVALYTVFGQISTGETEKTNVGWILMVTPEFRKAYPIDTRDLEKTVFRFRDVLRSDVYDPQPLAQEIYKKLFLQTSEKQKTTLAQDLETYLAKSPDKTLMWSLDGVLRYVPMSALHDGKSYLVEKYRNVVFNTASLGSLKDASKTNWEILGLGVSESKTVSDSNGASITFSPLKGAEIELRSLVKEKDGKDADGILNGTIKLNKDFTKQALFSGVRDGSAVVHIASHFAFNPAKEDSSFLLLGDGGKLEMNEFQDFPNLFQNVDLLSLSACDTATGSASKGGNPTENPNGKEVEGLAYVAQTLGAKSVMASLWQVSDEGTKELMLKFYAARKTDPILPKGEALRQAQLALLRGSYKTDERNKTDRSGVVQIGTANTIQPPFKKDPKAPFAHPYYWSPFVLIGNWR